jgi:hypothetical protein
MLCPQLKQNLETIKTLKPELDLELLKLEEVFKDLKKGNPSTLRLRSELRAERKELTNKIKTIIAEINLNSDKIKEKKDYFRELRKKAVLDILLKKLSPESKVYPEGTVEVGEIIIGEKTKEELIKELEFCSGLDAKDKNKIYISRHARFIYNSPAFEVLKKPERINLIRLTVEDLGFDKDATVDQIYQRAKKLGLELCPPEVGIYLRLNFAKAFKRWQSFDDYSKIAMEPIVGPHYEPIAFNVNRDDDGDNCLYGPRFNLTDEWSLTTVFIFCLRNSR